VVAGVRTPVIDIHGSAVPARVVYYNPDIDVAVLSVATGAIRPLRFTNATAGEGVAILGFPENGPYDVAVGRVRADQRLRSPDIYGHGTVIRDVLSLRGQIRPGNSGGPVVDSAGRVVGVVFAASVTSDDTGYALSSRHRAGVVQARLDPGVCHLGRRERKRFGLRFGLRASARRRSLQWPAPAAPDRTVLTHAVPDDPRLRICFASLACAIARSGARTFLTFRIPIKASRAATSR
jgi:S1-C subfamily serine protease